MAATSSSAALMPVTPVFTTAERLALAGFLAGYGGLAREASNWTCASTPAGATPITCACSALAAPTSSASPATWKPVAAPAPPSPAACAPSPVSTGTPSRKNSSTTHPPSTSAGRAWTTSRTR
jgi:hypothetical protein